MRSRTHTPGMLGAARAAVLLMLLALSACAAGGGPGDRLGQRDDAPTDADSVLAAETATGRPGANDEVSCRSTFDPDDVAGFVEEWFGIVAGLQLSVDANPIRQYLRDPGGTRIDELAGIQLCGAQILDPFRDSKDRRIAELARALSALLADAANAEKSNAERFRATDWSAFATIEEKARRWSETRPSTRSLSERGAGLTERIVALLREDGRIVYGPGRLRIARADRDVALRHRGRLTDLTIMVEHDVEPGGALSTAARKVLKWIYHAHGLTYAVNAPTEALDLPRTAE